MRTLKGFLYLILGGTLCGCTLPVIAALLYCLYKNGTLSEWLTPRNNCCCDN